MEFKSVLMCAFGVLLMSNWWFAMFSDSGLGQMARALNRSAARGRNFVALGLPLSGILFLLIGFLIYADNLGLSGVTIKTLGYVVFTFLVLTVVAFLPFRLPRWMYPEYHVARRERQRAEKLARGEVVRMPSSGPAAVEAQRIEQALRAQERQGESGR